ncbi:MAG: adenylate cyclase [Desulfobacteraceae bacterium Eth-SRB1]|nr:MAG: adenylate cyclase [Desulfobacteraceae bacterium Eth-SRB1]
MKSKYQNQKSFAGKTEVILVFLSVLPFLLAIYLFFIEKVDFTEMMYLFSALALFSILTGFTLMRGSADQLVNLVRETSDIETGKKRDPIRIDTDQELNDIAENFNSIIRKLHATDREIKEQSVQLMAYARDLSQSYQKMKEEEELRNRLSLYLEEHLVEKLIKSKSGVFFENERKEITILFADIRSFTAIAERMAPEDLVSMLNHFFTIMVDIIFRNNGMLDKFIGDQVMAVFGHISSNNSGPNDAVKAAVEMQHATEDLMKVRVKEGKETFGIGIGINTGKAIVGNVGSENRMDYTVIGNTVNVAARLEQMAKAGEIIIGEKTYQQTKGPFPVQKKSQVRVKNKTEPFICYKL